MKGLLLDSCIYIDILRHHQPAMDFIADLDRKPFVSIVTIMELYHGARSVSEEKHIEKLMDASQFLPLGREIAKQAGINLKHYRKSHNIDVPDAIIAATAEHHELELATLNLKHFPMFPQLKSPY